MAWQPPPFPRPSKPAESGETQRELVVTDRYNVPIAELSGLAIARAVEATRGAADMDGIRLYAIGDATYDVASLSHQQLIRTCQHTPE